jgi:23S rRNA (pseudouridine1915-N3)-methyltransferase
MLNFKILAFGKLDQKFFQEAFNFYAQKLKQKVNLEVIELKEFYQAEPQVNLIENTKLIENKLVNFPDYQKIILDLNSPLISSEKFALLIEKNQTFQGGKIIFIIGPSDGFAPDFVKQFQGFSFGHVTYPHQLFRILLIEQIYRALKINGHEKYHK